MRSLEQTRNAPHNNNNNNNNPQKYDSMDAKPTWKCVIDPCVDNIDRSGRQLTVWRELELADRAAGCRSRQRRVCRGPHTERR